jgi:hypothetical protein
MSEGATPPEGAGSATPPADATPPAPSQGTPPANGDYPEGLGDAGKRALDAERDARKAAEKLAADTARELAKIKAAQMSDEEKRDEELKTLRTQNAELLTERQQSRVREAAIAAARKANFWDPDLAYALIDSSDIAFDEAGKPKNVDALVAAIAKEKPKLVNGAPDFGGGNRGSAGAGSDMNAIIRGAAGR